MKKFVLSMMIVLAVAVFLPAMTCEASSVPVTELKEIIGNWYDTKGNLVLKISNDYKINGCTVLDIDLVVDTAGIYKIKIDEGNRYKTIELLYTGSNLYSDHEMLVMNWRSSDGNSLRRTKTPRYFESVGGIYLGMDKNQVVSLYGQPSSTENRESSSTWKYNDLGLDVHFQWNIVTGITIYPYGNRKFDWSGLSANNTRAEFKSRYGGKAGQLGESRGPWIIGYGESINFRNDSVTLSIDW